MLATVLEKIVSMGRMCFYPIVFVLTNMDENGVSLSFKIFRRMSTSYGDLVVSCCSYKWTFFSSFFLGFTIVQQQQKKVSKCDIWSILHCYFKFKFNSV